MSSQKALTAASTTSSNSSDALAVDITAAASGHNETFCSMLRSRSISSMCVLEDIHDADAKYIYGQCNEGNPFYVDLNRSRTHTYNTSLISDLVHYDKGADRGLSNWKLRCFGGFLGTFLIRSRLWDADRNVRLAVRRALQPGLTVYAREAIRAIVMEDSPCCCMDCEPSLMLFGGGTLGRDCHFAGALSPSLLKHLLKVEGGAAE